MIQEWFVLSIFLLGGGGKYSDADVGFKITP